MIDISHIVEFATIFTGISVLIYLVFFFYDRASHISLHADFGIHNISVEFEEGGSETRPVPALRVIVINRGKSFVHVSSVELFEASRLIPIKPGEFQSSGSQCYFRMEYLTPLEPNRRVSLFYEGKKLFEALPEDLKMIKMMSVKVQLMDELGKVYRSNRVRFLTSAVANIEYQEDEGANADDNLGDIGSGF